MSAFFDQRIVERIRADYVEMPGMKLTLEQVRRLCGIDQAACQLALDSLVQAGFLGLRSDGRYIRLAEGAPLMRRPVKAELMRISRLAS